MHIMVGNKSDESLKQAMPEVRKMYCLFDASVIVPYYLPKAHKNRDVHEHAVAIIESVRSGAAKHFFYIPNFCIAEVFSSFAKYAYGGWNEQVTGGTIDARVHKSLCNQFQIDIHNAALFYHYELSRYHVLAVGLVAAIDHYFKLTRRIGKKTCPAGTFDELIVAMGIHLTRIHGPENVVVITADNRLSRLIKKCRSDISVSALSSMKLDNAARFIGITFSPESFPLVLNLDTAKAKELKAIFGEWPLTIVGRYKKPYHLMNRRI